MSNVLPELATVRPRVIRAGFSDGELLEEVLFELVEEMPRGVVRIVGPAGSGKSTALVHLAAVFAHDERLVFLDEPTLDEIKQCGDGVLVVASSPAARATHGQNELKLAPWGFDELVEYLLATHGDACGSVMTRLGAAARRPWAPALAAIVLERFAADEAACDPVAELCGYVRSNLAGPEQFAAVRRYCLGALALSGKATADIIARLAAAAQCPPEVRALLRHPTVQAPLAAQGLVEAIAAGSVDDLRHPLSVELVELVGERCRATARAVDMLRALFDSDEMLESHSTAASILHVADPSWQPRKRTVAPWTFRNAYFARAKWPRIWLMGADLTRVDFSDAELEYSIFISAHLNGAGFDGAHLAGADFELAFAEEASFSGAILTGAKLGRMRLVRADFTDADLTGASFKGANLNDANLNSACMLRADLTGACLTGAKLEDANFTCAVLDSANLTGVDLRQTCLTGTSFIEATLPLVQMEDVQFPHAQLSKAVLSGAHLTGSVMPMADLRDACLRGAGLAEINWEGADLRGADLEGATFHMGSSRSGLVGSPIACEGSKTGFYTDDYEDMHFKRPEEVRKANLRGADLRGAKIGSLDFYLVDLREARLDPDQLVHVRKCGAILEDVVA